MLLLLFCCKLANYPRAVTIPRGLFVVFKFYSAFGTGAQFSKQRHLQLHLLARSLTKETKSKKNNTRKTKTKYICDRIAAAAATKPTTTITEGIEQAVYCTQQYQLLFVCFFLHKKVTHMCMCVCGYVTASVSPSCSSHPYSLINSIHRWGFFFFFLHPHFSLSLIWSLSVVHYT